MDLNSTNGLGTIAVGSVSELANILTNMSPDQLQNVRLDPALYDALSQSIDSTPPTEVYDLSNTNQSNLVHEHSQLINQVTESDVVGQMNLNLPQLANVALLNSSTQVSDVNVFNAHVINQPITNALVNQAVPLLASSSQVQSVFISPIKSVDSMQLQPVLNQTTPVLNVNNAVSMQNIVETNQLTFQDLTQFQGVLPGQGSSLIVTPTVMSQVQPTATIQTLKITDAQVLQDPVSTTLDVASQMATQSFITPMQTLTIPSNLMNVSTIPTSLLSNVTAINPNIVSNTFQTIQNTNTLNQHFVPATLPGSVNQSFVINGNTIIGNVVANSTLPTQQIILPGVVDSNQVGFTGQQVVLNGLPQQAVLLPVSQAITQNIVSPQSAIPTQVSKVKQVVATRKRATVQPQIKLDASGGSASLVLKDGTKVVLTQQQLDSIIKGKKVVCTVKSKTDASMVENKPITKTINKPINTNKRPMASTTVNAKPNVVKTISVISKSEAQVVQMKPKSVEQVQPGVFKFQLTQVNKDDANDASKNVIISKPMTLKNKAAEATGKELRPHKFHNYSPSVTSSSMVNSAEGRKNISSPTISKINKLSGQSMFKIKSSAGVSTQSPMKTSSGASTAQLLEIAKKINFKNQSRIVTSNEISTSAAQKQTQNKVKETDITISGNTPSSTLTQISKSDTVKKTMVSSSFSSSPKPSNNNDEPVSKVNVAKIVIVKSTAGKIAASGSGSIGKSSVKFAASPVINKEQLKETETESSSKELTAVQNDRKQLKSIEQEVPAEAPSLECKERGFVSPACESVQNNSSTNPSYKKIPHVKLDKLNAKETMEKANTSKEENEILQFREVIKSCQTGGESAMRQLAKLELENQLKRFAGKSKDSTASANEKASSSLSPIAKKRKSITASTDLKSTVSQSVFSVSNYKGAVKDDTKKRTDFSDRKKFSKTSHSSKELDIADAKRQEDEDDSDVTEGKEGENRKRERPKRFNDFVFPPKKKREKKNKKFFFPKGDNTIVEQGDSFDIDLNEKENRSDEHNNDNENASESKSNEVTDKSVSAKEDVDKINNKKITQAKKKKKRKLKQKKIAVELEVLPEHLKTKSKSRNTEDAVIDLTKVKLKSAFAEKTFALNDVIEYRTYTRLAKSKWLCTFCGKPGNLATLDVLFGPYRVKVQSRDSTKDITMNVWMHRDCALWTSSICLSNQILNGLGDALDFAAKTTCSACSEVGATLECGSKQCRDGYHFVCAKQRGCSFKMENFTIICPKHK